MHMNWLDHSGCLIDSLCKPNIILAHSGTQSDLSFKDLLPYCKVKGPCTTNSQNEALKQLTDVTGFASASQLNHHFYVASSLCDRKFQLVSFICGTIIISEPINIDSKPIPFITAVLGFSVACCVVWLQSFLSTCCRWCLPTWQEILQQVPCQGQTNTFACSNWHAWERNQSATLRSPSANHIVNVHNCTALYSGYSQLQRYMKDTPCITL